MQFKMTKSVAGKNFAYRKNGVYNLPKHQIEEFTRLGWAVLVDDKAKVKVKVKAKDPEPAPEQEQVTPKKRCTKCNKKKDA